MFLHPVLLSSFCLFLGGLCPQASTKIGCLRARLTSTFGSFAQVACLAKETFSLWAMSQMFGAARRSDFYDIGVFILNPIPPSFVERARCLPDTVRRAYTWERGEFYPDLGGLLADTSFDVNVVVTRSGSELPLSPRGPATSNDHVSVRRKGPTEGSKMRPACSSACATDLMRVTSPEDGMGTGEGGG